jgi:hypothetical protein
LDFFFLIMWPFEPNFVFPEKPFVSFTVHVSEFFGLPGYENFPPKKPTNKKKVVKRHLWNTFVFLKHNSRPNLTSHWHPPVKLTGRGPARVSSPVHNCIWRTFLWPQCPRRDYTSEPDKPLAPPSQAHWQRAGKSFFTCTQLYLKDLIVAPVSQKRLYQWAIAPKGTPSTQVENQRDFPQHYVHRRLHFFFFFSIFWHSHTCNHPQEELVKFGYRSERKVKKI